MPQLDFSNPLIIAQIIWLLIIFGALYYMLAAYALPRVESVLEDRAARIAADLEAAQLLKAEADAAIVAHREATTKARAEAQSAIAAAMQQAQAEAAARSEALNARLNRQIAEAEARIAASRDVAMGALRQVASETATSLVAKLSGRADAAAVDAAVGRALATRQG